ncbi:hypothetical protein PMAYCL1PPCAC_12789, partial [Pristionchus mayeri]
LSLQSRVVRALIECYIRDLFPFQRVRVCITGRSEAYTFVSLRPEISFGSLESEAKLRGLKMLRVTYNGQHEFEIAENLWGLHTPHFDRSVFHSSSMSPVVECPFPESVMRMCERAFLDPSSTENYTTNQLLNMLDVADYVCANLLAQDVIYRLLRNATRLDVNEILGEIVQTLNSRSSLVEVLSHFPHILLDWPLDVESDVLFEACERMQQVVGPVPRVIETNGSMLIPTHYNISLFILASPNYELAVGLNEVPLSNETSRERAEMSIFSSCHGEETILNLMDKEDRSSLLFHSFRGEKGITEKSKRLFEGCNRRFERHGGDRERMQQLEHAISMELEQFLTTVPSSPEPTPIVTPKEKTSTRRIRRHTHRKSEREQELEVDEKKEVDVKRIEDTTNEVVSDHTPSTPMGMKKEEDERKTVRSFAEILKEEEEMEAAKKPLTPKRGEGGRRSKFRPLSFSDSSTPSKNVDVKHDWTQSPRPSTPKEKQTKSFMDIMKEQSERKSGVTRRRGPSVSGCQMEAAAIEALSDHYRLMVENHQLVVVEVCWKEEEAPRWNADGDLHLD